MTPDKSAEKRAQREAKSVIREASRRPLGTDYVGANPSKRVEGSPPGLMMGAKVHAYYVAQERRLPGRTLGNEDFFKKIDFSLVNPDQVNAVVTATLIASHHVVEEAQALEYHRPDHELGAVEVIKNYYDLRTYGTLRTYLEASSGTAHPIVPTDLERQLEIVRATDGEGPIEVPLVQYLVSSAMRSVDTRIFYMNLALNVAEPILRAELSEFATDQNNLTAFLLDRIQTELAKARVQGQLPERLREVDAALLDFSPNGQAFITDFEKRRQTMLKVSPPGIFRADLVRGVVRKLVGQKHLNDLERQRPFRDKLLAA